MHAAQSGVNNLTTERANKPQEGHIAASVTTSKGYFYLYLKFMFFIQLLFSLSS